MENVSANCAGIEFLIKSVQFAWRTNWRYRPAYLPPVASNSTCEPRWMWRFSVVDHQDQIRPHDRAEPMGDDERRSPGEQFLQRLLHQHFRGGIDGAGGLVEHEDSRVGQKRAGEADELSLTQRHARAAFADVGFKSAGRRHDGIIRPDRLGGGDHLLRWWLPAGHSGCFPSPFR